MCSSSQGGFAFCQDGEKTRHPHGTGAVPSTLLMVAGWVGALRGKGCPGWGCTVCGGVQEVPRARLDLCEGSRGQWGTAGLCRRGSSSLGSRWQPGRCRHRELGPGTVSAPPRQLQARSAPMHGVKEGRGCSQAQHHPMVVSSAVRRAAAAASDGRKS